MTEQERADEHLRTMRLIREDVSQIRTFVGFAALLLFVIAAVLVLWALGGIEPKVEPVLGP